MSHEHHATGHSCCHESVNEPDKDPVCGMTVDPSHAAGSHAHGGTTYYFCSTHCLAKFKAAPEQFVGNSALPKHAQIQPSGTGEYTCPMHPEVIQDGPGTCPKCGMALEPMQPSATEGPDPELIAMQRRFWVGMILTVPIFLIAMAGLLPFNAVMTFLHGNMLALNWVQLVLATPVVLWCGWPFFQRAWLSVLNRC